MGLIQSVEGLNRTKTEEGILPADSPLTWMTTSAFSWVSTLQAGSTDFRISSHRNHGNQFLKINLSFYMCTFCWFYFSGEPWLTQDASSSQFMWIGQEMSQSTFAWCSSVGHELQVGMEASAASSRVLVWWLRASVSPFLQCRATLLIPWFASIRWATLFSI